MLLAVVAKPTPLTTAMVATPSAARPPTTAVPAATFVAVDVAVVEVPGPEALSAGGGAPEIERFAFVSNHAMSARNFGSIWNGYCCAPDGAVGLRYPVLTRVCSCAFNSLAMA